MTSYAQAIGKLGPTANTAVPSLICIMRGNNQNTGAAGIGRFHAIMALGKIGGTEAINGLKSMRSSWDLNIVDAVNEGLQVAQSND